MGGILMSWEHRLWEMGNDLVLIDFKRCFPATRMDGVCVMSSFPRRSVFIFFFLNSLSGETLLVSCHVSINVTRPNHGDSGDWMRKPLIWYRDFGHEKLPHNVTPDSGNSLNLPGPADFSRQPAGVAVFC